MGTSGSSKGSPGKVPMVPPWVPDVPAAPPADQAPPPEPSPPTDQAPANQLTPNTAPVAAPPAPAPPIPIAPAGRFTAARRSANNFAQTGSSSDLRRSIGHYVRTGYGGASTAARRLAGTARTAGSLYGTLSPTPTATPVGPDSGARLDRALLSGRSANEVMDAVVEAVRPVDGTQDAEAGRTAIKASLSECLFAFLAPTYSIYQRSSACSQSSDTSHSTCSKDLCWTSARQFRTKRPTLARHWLG